MSETPAKPGDPAQPKHPQCLITVEWSLGEIRTLYAARCPGGLDLMAKWAPIFHNGGTPVTNLAR